MRKTKCRINLGLWHLGNEKTKGAIEGHSEGTAFEGKERDRVIASVFVRFPDEKDLKVYGLRVNMGEDGKMGEQI